jgi:hypothetical protein
MKTNDEYLMNSLFEECGCKKKKPIVPLSPPESSPIISENKSLNIAESNPPNNTEHNLSSEKVNEGCNCSKRKITKLLTQKRPSPKPSKLHFLNKNSNKKLHEEYHERGKYDISLISKIALKNLAKWVPYYDFNFFRNELNHKSDKEVKDFFCNFVDTHLDNFFDIYEKYNVIERMFLEEHRKDIIESLYKIAASGINLQKEQNLDLPEEGDVEEIIRQSKIKKEEPIYYSKMSQYDLKKEVDKALDSNDFDTLRKIQPYLKEGFLKYHVNDFLNENKDYEYIIPKLRKGVK